MQQTPTAEGACLQLPCLLGLLGLLLRRVAVAATRGLMPALAATKGALRSLLGLLGGRLLRGLRCCLHLPELGGCLGAAGCGLGAGGALRLSLGGRLRNALGLGLHLGLRLSLGFPLRPGLGLSARGLV